MTTVDYALTQLATATVRWFDRWHRWCHDWLYDYIKIGMRETLIARPSIESFICLGCARSVNWLKVRLGALWFSHQRKLNQSFVSRPLHRHGQHVNHTNMGTETARSSVSFIVSITYGYEAYRNKSVNFSFYIGCLLIKKLTINGWRFIVTETIYFPNLEKSKTLTV